MKPVEVKLEATLSELISGSMFEEICQSFFELAEVPIRVFDHAENSLADTAKMQPPCEYIRGFENGRRRCTQKRLEVKKASAAPGDPFNIDCFCGLRYKIAPIYFQNDVMGKIAIGPYLPTELERLPEEIREIDTGLDVATLSHSFGQLKRLSDAGADKIVNTLLSVTEAILFSAHKAYVTSEMHIATIRESYRELTKKNQALEDLNEERREFEHLKANFLATISHELRTPLTSIIGYSDMLAEGIGGELPAEQRQFVETIKSKGDDLLKLISSILDFSRIDSGHMQLQVTDSNPELVLMTAIDSLQASAERRGIKLSMNVEEGLKNVRFDPDKMRTAVSHLIENAIKFSSPGGIVKASVRMTEADEADSSEDDGIGFVLMTAPKMIEFVVEDFGLGIDETDQARIFSPFAQLDNSSTREHGGAGLGLSIVKHYVEAHGGRISVTSRVGKGSRFSLRLPLTG